MVTRPLSAHGNRSTQPRASSFFTTCDRRESEALVRTASSLIRSVRSALSESIARHR